MKKIAVLCLLTASLTVGAYACPCRETTTETTYESIQISTVEISDDAYVSEQKPAQVAAPCRVRSSIDLATRPRNCNTSATLRPVRVKKYTEVIDHYQEYQPVVQYVPSGTHTTRRVIEY